MSRGEGNIKGRDGVICYLPWMPLAGSLIAVTGGFPYIFPLTSMLSGAPILLMALQILTTLSRPVSICAIGMLVAKESMPLATTGFGRIIG